MKSFFKNRETENQNNQAFLGFWSTFLEVGVEV